MATQAFYVLFSIINTEEGGGKMVVVGLGLALLHRPLEQHIIGEKR
jgi:hypothetical protein